MKKVLLVGRNTEVEDSRADLLRNYGLEATVSSPDNAERAAVGKSYESILITLGDFGMRDVEMIGKLSAQNPHSKIVVYSTQAGIREAADQIMQYGAMPLVMIKKTREIADALS